MKRPQAKGSKWIGDDYVHGPRVRAPEDFEKIYTVPVPWAYRRLGTLPQKPKEAEKVVVGSLKKTGKLAVQSYLTPIKRSRWMRSKKGKLFFRKWHQRRVKKSIRYDPKITKWELDLNQAGSIREAAPIIDKINKRLREFD